MFFIPSPCNYPGVIVALMRHDNITCTHEYTPTQPKSNPMQRTPSYSQANDKVTEMNSLSMVMNKAVKNGYMESFKVTGQGLTTQSNPEQAYMPDQVQVINFYRFEGESDPGDNSIMYQIETADGTKGVLVDAYGPYADAKVNDFMRQVEDIQKKVVKEDTSADEQTPGQSGPAA
jgi:hypothetical protein